MNRIIPSQLVLFFSSILLSTLSFAIGIRSFASFLSGKPGGALSYPDQCWVFLIAGAFFLVLFLVLAFFVVLRDIGESRQRDYPE